MSEQQFRSAAVGGFNKQDVLDYIKKSAKAHADEVERLRGELEETKAAQAEAEERAEQLKENLRACAASLVATRDSLDEKLAALEEKTAALDQAEKRATALEQEVERLRPAAQAYEVVKQKMADMEQEAQQRVSQAATTAERKAELTCIQLERWVRRVQAGYDRLRTDVDATMAHASGELERIRRSLDGVAEEFAENDATLEELLRIVREAGGPNAPKPLRLDGE